MSSSVYTRLAFTNLKNNRKTYLPYILTAVLVIMMYYIMETLSGNDRVTASATLQIILVYGANIMAVFAVIFLFYTNSFLIKRRKKEIGVYNILGMGKGHIAKMLFVETSTTAAVSIVFGLLAGTLFSRLLWLMLLKALCYDVGMKFQMSGEAMVKTIVLFAGLFLLTYCYNLWQIKLANPVELLHGSNEGEKEPKTKWLLTIAGILLVGLGYYISITTESPLLALPAFFIAVLCVILGTYALFIAGSVALLKMLKKNKKFYYKANHFTSVSGMIYRMKQNAAGLATICILSTMVMVTVSTTVSLYVGMEDILAARFPRDFSVECTDAEGKQEEAISRIINEESKTKGVKIKEMIAYHYGECSAIQEENRFLTEVGDADVYTGIKGMCWLYLIPLEDYSEMEGRALTLKDDEALFYNPDADAEPMKEDTLQLGSDTYRIKEELETMAAEPRNRSRNYKAYYIVLNDTAKIERCLQESAGIQSGDAQGSDTSSNGGGEETDSILTKIGYTVKFDLKGSEKSQNSAMEAMRARIKEEVPEAECESKEFSKESFYELYGGLLFIGIYLGIMFLMATVLIIYYKQISEGYDDRERYQIMQKVGMSKREVKRSIKSQIRLVFFLPLIVAVIHITAAFPVVAKLLKALNLANTSLYFTCTAVTAAVFAALYVVVFALTAKEYYRIVN